MGFLVLADKAAAAVVALGLYLKVLAVQATGFEHAGDDFGNGLFMQIDLGDAVER